MKKDKIKFPEKEEVLEMLRESNAIESEYSERALKDALSAWKYVITLDSITVYDVLYIHKLLLGRLRPDIAGELRTCDVFIGGKKKKFIGVLIAAEQLKELLKSMVRIIHSKGKNNNDKITKTYHVLFEDLHPFEDGNGRTGRILYNWHRLHMGLPIHIIHEGVEQYEYYSWFK